jgi:UDP-N-acetylmuramoyl-L-alanyl-D-glutamate--2,6-diaminopimelate ligase
MFERHVPLSELIGHLFAGADRQFPAVPITGISLDSRQVHFGHIFFALSGGTVDGHRFIPDAIGRGAVAVIGSQPLSGLPVPYLRVEDVRAALAVVSAAYYGFPARRLTVLGITGTDGKTTTASLIFATLQAAGLAAGMISTVSARIGESSLDTGFHVTTPEAPDVQRYLAQMLSSGLTHVVLEATSHGLDQKRVAACEFDLAVVTNITHEHLDYHGSAEAYRAAKAQLFLELARTAPKDRGNPRVAVLNRDDASYDYLSGIIEPLAPPVRPITYGFHPQADVRAGDVEHGPGGLRFTAVVREKGFRVRSRLVGAYNVSNCLAAIAATVAGLALDPAAAQAGIASLESIPGRMETIDLGQPFLALVDFAHTPNALRRALETARQLVSGRVIAVFGSAGLRDRAKRRMMAEIAAELADLTVLTAEDPRTEPLESILAEMAMGAEARGGIEGRTFWRVLDRGQALEFALSLASPGDLVIACGKGHEQSMCFGETEYPWDDRRAMQAALAKLLALPGPEMPYLPTQDSPAG